MKSAKHFFIFISSILLFSCSDKNTLCHQEKSAEAIKESIIESVSDQSDFLAREYSLTQVEVQLQKLFKENKIQLKEFHFMNASKVDSMNVCNCGVKLSFNDNGEFIKSIEPIVSEMKKIDDKYSSEYLKNKHLLKYSDKEYYPFFFSVFEADQKVSASENDYKVGSLLIDFLKANRNS